MFEFSFKCMIIFAVLSMFMVLLCSAGILSTFIPIIFCVGGVAICGIITILTF